MIRDKERNERIDMMLEFLQHETDVDIEKVPFYDREIYNSISVNNSDLKPYLADRVFHFADRINCFYDLCRVLGVTEDACEAISIRDPSNQRGLFPLFAERLFKELKKPQTDWRMVLNDFVQQEIVDYSFTPPDRRFDESPFFLPDFNDKDDLVEDILFMIDTSGSMSDGMITAAYSEVKGAIDQFDGKLKGWLGFFDAAIVAPKPFTNEDEFKIIKPAGGGGTDFQIIFEYVQKHMQGKLPACIIILTDGYAPFPREKLAGGIPVLWLLNNKNVAPPWGKVARITV